MASGCRLLKLQSGSTESTAKVPIPRKYCNPGGIETAFWGIEAEIFGTEAFRLVYSNLTISPTYRTPSASEYLPSSPGPQWCKSEDEGKRYFQTECALTEHALQALTSN